MTLRTSPRRLRYHTWLGENLPVEAGLDLVSCQCFFFFWGGGMEPPQRADYSLELLPWVGVGVGAGNAPLLKRAIRRLLGEVQ